MQRTWLVNRQCWWLLLIPLLLWPGSSLADRYHVRVDGLRGSGPSTPDDWSLANCYPTLATALTQTSTPDSLLLYKEDHDVSTRLVLPSFLGNQDLDAAYQDCRLLLSGSGFLMLTSPVTHFVIQGISFIGMSPQYPPAIYILNDNPRIQDVLVQDCAFRNNEGSRPASGGSCINADNPGFGLRLTLIRCIFRENSAQGFGGAMFVGDGYQLYCDSCQFIDNESLTGSQSPDAPRGGALAVWSKMVPTFVVMEHCRIDSNRSPNLGGGLAIEDAHLTLFDCDVTENRSAVGSDQGWAAGAGLSLRHNDEHLNELQLEIIQCRFIGNRGNLAFSHSAGGGGGVLVRGLTDYNTVNVNINETIFADNFNAQGGGIYVGRFTTGVIERSTFLRNTALLNGGASYKGGDTSANLGETVEFRYCEFIQNKAGYDQEGQNSGFDGRGGAFMTRLNPRADFTNCSFSENRSGGATQYGDAIYHWDEGQVFTSALQRCSLVNCAFYGTNGLDVQIRSEPFGFIAVTHCAFAAGEFVCSGVIPISPVELGGSPYVSPLDLHLHDTSPCIDAGLTMGLTPDIEGNDVPHPRTMITDIGAFEYQFPLPIWLQDFTAVAASGEVTLNWQTLFSENDVSFRVTAARQGQQWDVPYSDLGAGHYEAHDDAALLAEGGRVVYNLHGHEPGQGWTELGQTALELQPIAARVQLRNAYPNPFNPRTTVAFAVVRANWIRLGIYDSMGRRVAVLTEGVFPTGLHEVEWDGRNSSGHAVAAGVYYVRLEHADRQQTIKLTLVR